MARDRHPARLCGVTRLLALLVALAGALSSVSLAAAHAEPARATPGDKAVLNAAPSEIVFEMSQEMARQEGQNDIDVFDAAGNEVTTIAAVIDNNDRQRLSVVLPSGLNPGTYTARWKTLSAEDGDPATGETTFTYDPAATPSEGTVALRPDLLGGTTPEATGAAPAPAGLDLGGNDDGVTWVLVVAVGTAMLVLGAGATFVFVRRQP